MAFYMLSLSGRYILYNTDFYDTDINRSHLCQNCVYVNDSHFTVEEWQGNISFS